MGETQKRVTENMQEDMGTKVRTFHIHAPADVPLPLLPRTCYPSQPPITVDGLSLVGGHVQRCSVRCPERRIRRAGEKRVDVVDLLVRLRQGNEVQPSRPRTHQNIVNIERSGVEARATHHGWIQSEKNSV